MRYIFEKHGTFPKEYIELDDYSKGIIYAFLEDIGETALKNKREIEAQQAKIRTH